MTKKWDWRIALNIHPWLESRCTKEATTSTRASILYRDYLHWCIKHPEAKKVAILDYPVTNTYFGVYLSSLFNKKRTAIGILYTGVNLNEH